MHGEAIAASFFYGYRGYEQPFREYWLQEFQGRESKRSIIYSGFKIGNKGGLDN
jgi:hypothetical protein